MYKTTIVMINSISNKSDEKIEKLIRRPKVVFKPQWELLCLLVVSGCATMLEKRPMGITKADFIGKVISDFVSRLKCGRMRNNISLSIVNYDQRIVVKMPPTSVKSIDEDDSFNPTIGLGDDSANVGGALEEALRIANEFMMDQMGSIPRLVEIVLLTDGYDSDKKSTRTALKKIDTKQKIWLSGIGYVPTEGSDDDKTTIDYLKSLVGDSKTRCIDSMCDILRFFVSGTNPFAIL